MRTLLSVLVVMVLGTAWADDPPANQTKPPYERLLQGDDKKTAAALEKKIDELEKADQYAEAVKVAEELAALRVRVQGADHWETRDARNRVRTLQTVMTLPATARAQLREAAQATQEANDYYARGQYAAAQPLYERALAIWRQALGEQHPDTARGYSNLALNLHAQGRYADAQPLLEKALAIFRQALGEEHPRTAAGYLSLAHSLDAQGKHAAAQPLLEKALAIDRQALGEEHPDTARGYNNLAANLNAQGKYADAQLLYEKSLAIRRQALGEQHPDTAQGYNNLALNLVAQGKHADAQPLLEKALAICRQTLGEQHPDTAQCYHNLGVNLDEQGKHADAQPLHEKALAICRQTLGEQHPDTAIGYNGLAYNLNAQGRYAAAQPLFEKALAIRRQSLGEQHPDTAQGYNNLAFTLNAQGKYADAQLLYEKALAIDRQALGEQHPTTALWYRNLAINLQAQGKYADALATLEQASHSYETSRLVVAHGLDRSVALRSPYPLQATLLARLARPRDAWQALQRDLARGLLDEQAGRRERPLSPTERTKQSSLTERLAAIQPRILHLLTRPQRSQAEQHELDKLTGERRRLNGELGDLAAALSQREVAALDNIRKALPADAALVTWIDISVPGA